MYQFVLSNPLNHSDPNGLCTVSSFNVNEYDRQCHFHKDKKGGLFGYRISVVAEFAEPCGCCEYRQYITCGVRLREFRAGSWGNWMTLFEYGELREDCEVDENGVRHCYGYRNDQSPTDRYLLDGCIYQNLDIPGQGGINDAFDRVGPDFKVEVDIHCRLLLSIIDTGDNTVVHSQTLDFSCRGEVTPPMVGGRPRPNR